LWLHKGDTNSMYFHSVMLGSRRGNAISSLDVDGVRVKGVNLIRAVVFEHFSSHFMACEAARPVVGDLSDILRFIK